MSDRPDYKFELDERYGPFELMDVPALAAACEEEWWNQTLCRVNGCVARLGVLQGEFHWHHHDVEDELFFVLSGRLTVEIENGETVELGPHQGTMVPHGIEHRTVAPERTVVLMFEGRGVQPAGDS
jgi:mannose-6-phosphate isomerase-like protein (cupin superfamily)